MKWFAFVFVLTLRIYHFFFSVHYALSRQGPFKTTMMTNLVSPTPCDLI